MVKPKLFQNRKQWHFFKGKRWGRVYNFYYYVYFTIKPFV